MLLPDSVVRVRYGMELWSKMHDDSEIVVAVHVRDEVRRYPRCRTVLRVDNLHILRKLSKPDWEVRIVSDEVRIQGPVTRLLPQLSIHECGLLNVLDDSNVLRELTRHLVLVLVKG